MSVPFASGNGQRPYSCPGCGQDLRHRLVDGEAKTGRFECSACRAWIDETPDGYAVVAKVLPLRLEEALAEDEP